MDFREDDGAKGVESDGDQIIRNTKLQTMTGGILLTGALVPPCAVPVNACAAAVAFPLAFALDGPNAVTADVDEDPVKMAAKVYCTTTFEAAFVPAGV
jgi:hypothetical protein